MSIPKGKNHQGIPNHQGFSQQRFAHPTFPFQQASAASKIVDCRLNGLSFLRSSTPQRTDVGFHHVSAGTPANFPPGGPAGPQQGGPGGVGPGGGPPQLGGGGGRVAPPQQAAVGPPQQGGPPQAGAPGPGGPPGPPQLPGPTSTPPGHAGPPDLGKGPHLQPQPVPQAGQLSGFQVQNATRQNQSQPTYFNARAPATRMTNRGPPVVSMAANVPGQQMFPQHMQPMQMQAVYPSVGLPPLGVGQNAMYLSPSQMPLFQPQTRHQNPANSAATAATYYPQHGPHILMAQMPFPGYSTAHTGQHGPHYYYQQLSARPAPAGAGPPTAGPGAQQVVGAAGPTGAPQAMPLLQMGAAHGLGGPPVGPADVSGPPSQGPPGPQSAQHHVVAGGGTRGKSRRPNALEVIDPKTGACVDIYESGGSGTPPRSGESSARETPQPSSVQGNSDVAAEFAALVAKAASDDGGIPPAGRRPQSREFPHSGNTGQSLDVVAEFAARVAKAASEKTSPPPQQGQVSNTPLQAQPTQVQGPPPPFPSDTQPVVNGPEHDKVLTPEELPSRPPGVKPGNDVTAEVFRPMPVHSDHQPIPTIINKELQDVGGTPVVSARTNAPAVEVVHRREHFPALKGSSAGTAPGTGSTVTGVTGPPSAASPRRKPPSASTPPSLVSQEKPGLPTAASVPSQQASASIVPPISVAFHPPQRSGTPPVAASEPAPAVNVPPAVAPESAPQAPAPVPAPAPAPALPALAKPPAAPPTQPKVTPHAQAACLGRTENGPANGSVQVKSKNLVLGPPAVPASAEPKPPAVVSAASQQAPPPVTASAPKKQGPPPQVDVPAFPPKDGPKASASVVRVGTGPPPGAKTVTPVSSATSTASDAVPPRAGGKPPARKEVPASAIPVHRDGPPTAVRAPKGGELPSAVSRSAAPVSTPRPPSRSPTPPVLPLATPHAPTPAPPPPSSPAPVPAAAPTEDSRPNGEVPEPAPQQIESSKQSSRSKSKRTQKMREQNKKGAEKEGTDMDAFSEAPPSAPAASPAPAAVVENATTPVEEPATQPPPPANVPARESTPPAVQAAEKQPPPSISPAPSSTPARPASPAPRPASPVPETQPPVKENEKEKDQEKEKEKGEEEAEGEKEKEQKLVAARNEANAKVSAAALKEKKEDEIIENIPPKPVLPVPKQMYREDQWSPFNPDGKKKYERDFLIKLKDTTEAKKKPEIRPDVLNFVLKDKVNRQPRLPDLSRGPHDNFTPAFTKSQSYRGQPVTKRGSQQGKAKSGAKPPIIQYSIKTEVKLRETENAWKPARMRGSQAEQDKTADLYKKVRGVLNKLTPQKFHTLVQQVQALPIDNSERLHGVIDLVFEKAVDEPSYSVAYAQMCKVLSNMQVADGSKEGQPENFRKLLLSRCQHEFEKNTQADLKRDERLKEIEQCTDPEKKKELQLEFEETERRLRMKSVGNIRFVGELFKLGMLTSNIMHRCIQHLLKQRDEESLECLCKLLTTIGKDVESKKHDLSNYFDEMKVLSKQRGQISSRVRFMLQDVIELRDNKWVPRRDDSAPKTIDQIQREAERESMMEMQMPSGGGGGSRGGGGGRDDRGGDRRKRGGGGPSEDGWQSVQRKNLDTSKLRIKASDLTNVSLGGSNQFAAWTQGAGGNSDSDRSSAFPQTSNTFAALQDVDDKKSGVMFSRPYGKQPPPSNTEREKAVNSLRNFVSAEKEERQARTASSRTPSRSSSREGSSARQTPAPSSSQSRDDLAAVVQPVASGSSAISDQDTRKNLPHLNPDQVAKKIQFILEEFVTNNNFQESALCVSETFPPSNMGNFVVETMNILLERSATVRSGVGKLMGHLMKEGILTTEQFLEGFKEIAEVADDLAIDVPKVWLYLAEILVPMLSTEALTFSDLKTAATGLHKLVVEILRLLVKEKGPGWVRQRWDVAGMSWKDFAPADSIDRIVKENKLEFTVGPAGEVAPLTPEMIHTKLLQMLRPEQGAPATTDEVTKWISANVGDRAKTPEFIRVLTTAVCESAYQAAGSKKFEEALFSKHATLLQKYIDTNEELELHCLYAVQELNHRLEQPSGLLRDLFQALWDYGCVANETFLRWEQSKDPAFLQGKGVALKSLTAFFTALREADDDSSEECASGQ
ncbi:eukaryotic translation initiation factor 4 gamma 1-like isoform X3 [Schistocerca cancellata]|uniref:eukaryotic translation initiation factor 4 gamma 1-like isoform X3 n=1 Tax=Schistocerca cancellata TaxID=274614 RepID=UPI002118760D|nr:eukaryotic translation initiation factor 4 gamma 1-like isoform X3 [Schistocerca cancellata]